MTPKGKANLGYALIALGFGMFLAGPFVVLAAGIGGIAVALPSILGFFIMAAGGLALSASGMAPPRSRKVADGATLKCPNCGAGAKSMDADGFATCAYCGTRFVPLATSPVK